MKFVSTLLAVLLTVSITLSSPALAQSVNSEAEISSSTTTNSQSGSQAVVIMEGHEPLSETRLETAPPVAPPGLTSGINSCAASTSVGGSGMGFGLSAGRSYSDRNCERRAHAEMLWNAGVRDVAILLICQNRDVARAFQEAGQTCAVAAVAAQTAYVEGLRGRNP